MIGVDLAMNGDMINYKGAWIYPIDGGYEANLRGFHYDAESLDELKSKIDVAVKTDDPGRTLKLYSADPRYYSVMNEDGEDVDGPEWLVVYYLGGVESDDSFEDKDTIEIVLTAPNFEAAVKYAQQYIRKMQSEASTKERWADAEIISIDQR